MRRLLLIFTILLMHVPFVSSQTERDAMGSDSKTKMLIAHKAMQECLMANKEYNLDIWADLSAKIAMDTAVSPFLTTPLEEDEVETNERHVCRWELFLKSVVRDSFDMASISSLNKKIYMVDKGDVIDTDSDLQSLLHFYKQVKDQNVVKKYKTFQQFCLRLGRQHHTDRYPLLYKHLCDILSGSSHNAPRFIDNSLEKIDGRIVLNFYLDTQQALTALGRNDSVAFQNAWSGFLRSKRKIFALQHSFGENVEMFKVVVGLESSIFAVNCCSGKVYTLYGYNNDLLRFYLDHYDGTFPEFCRSVSIEGVDLQCYRKYLKEECRRKSVNVNKIQFPCIAEG